MKLPKYNMETIKIQISYKKISNGLFKSTGPKWFVKYTKTFFQN